MSGRSTLLEQKERMQEKRRSMAQDRAAKSPTQTRAALSSATATLDGGAGARAMGQVKEEEEHKEQSSSDERMQPPTILVVS